MADLLRDAVARMESALAEALETVTAVGTPAEIENFVRLLMQKKIVTEMLLDKIDTLAAVYSIEQSVSTFTKFRMDRSLATNAMELKKVDLENMRNFRRFFL